jgi:hypothetical protein
MSKLDATNLGSAQVGILPLMLMQVTNFFLDFEKKIVFRSFIKNFLLLDLISVVFSVLINPVLCNLVYTVFRSIALLGLSIGVLWINL